MCRTRAPGSRVTGHDLNWWCAWRALWGAIAAEEISRKVYARGPYAAIACDLAAYEIKCLARACYALGTTAAILECETPDKE